jgi:hypothetical protein
VSSTTDDLAARFATEHAAWTALLAKVPPDRMDEPGAMGSWTFRDAVSHLAAWRRRAIMRLEAAARGELRPSNPWPAGMDDDAINDWFREQDDGRSADDLLAEYDASFDRMAAAVAALPDGANPTESETPGYYRWNDANGELESDFFGHLRGHIDDVEAWLARS